MATPSIIDIDLIRGDDFEKMFQIATCDVTEPTTYPTGILTEATVIDGVTWTPLNLTGSLVRSDIRKTNAYLEPIAMSFTVWVEDASIGLFRMTLNDEQTNALASNNVVKYKYDVEVITNCTLEQLYPPVSEDITYKFFIRNGNYYYRHKATPIPITDETVVSVLDGNSITTTYISGSVNVFLETTR